MLEHALREAFGMSARQAKRFAAQGAKGLGADEPVADVDVGELADRLTALERSLRL